MTGPLRFGLRAQTSMVQLQLNRIQSEMRSVEEQALTGLKLIDPSDMPSSLGEVDALQSALSDQAIWQDNATFAINLMDTADSALGDARNSLTRAREIAVLGASETGVATERALLADEVGALIDSMVATGNTRFGDRYLFAGEAYGTQPFADDGTYQGAGGDPRTRVGESTYASTGFDGGNIFRGDADPIATLQALQTALANNDSDAVAATLDDLDRALDQVIEARAGVGAATVKAEEAASVSSNLEAALQSRTSDLVGIDEFQVYSDLANLRTSYEGALQVSATSTRSTLFDFI